MWRYVFLCMFDGVPDFAILMIAVHSALCVFNPGGNIGENGLYPYRYTAYALWVIFPILMASLAFLNPFGAYVASPSACYLPVRPFWYRLGLSWIPRYTILIAITAIYLAMNLYVRYIFRSFKLSMGSTYEETVLSPDVSADISADSVSAYHSTPPRKMSTIRDRQQPLPPQMPRLSCHGLIPPSPVTTGLADGQIASPPFSEPPKIWRAPSNARQRWDGSAPNDPLSPGDPHLETQDNYVTRGRGRLDSDDYYYSGSSYSYSFPSQESAEERLRQGHRFRTPNRLVLVDSRGEDLAMRELRHTRDTIRRQLRLLFIYPLVYVLMWIIPFISHCLQFNDDFAYRPPFPLDCLVTFIIPFQCAVDCWVFSTREKPWRAIPGSSGTFWNSFLVWKHNGPESQNCRFTNGPGKSRAEMLAAAREAYRRRDEELRAAVEEQRKRKKDRQLGLTGKDVDDRAWWEEGGREWRESIWQDSIIEERSEASGRPRYGRISTGRSSIGRDDIESPSDEKMP
jgi:G protein-coupled receptor GPR1